MTLKLSQAAGGVLDASGGLTLILTPRSSMAWHISRLSVMSTSVKPPKVLLYDGEPADSTLIEGTYSGDLDTTDTEIIIEPTESLYVVWSGGDPGANASIRITGIQR